MAKEKEIFEDARLSDREGGPRDQEDNGAHEMTTAQREQSMQMTDPERRREIRRRWSESILPNLPKQAGWHSCWVSTTHPIDTPQRRRRYGYRFMKYEDLTKEGWAADVDAIKDGHFAGAVMWRELVAMECTVADYNAYMREFHFDQPAEQVEGIFAGLDQTGDEAKRRGGKITLEEEMIEMRKRMQRPPPQQFEG
jgi:hypothetical protein